MCFQRRHFCRKVTEWIRLFLLKIHLFANCKRKPAFLYCPAKPFQITRSHHIVRIQPEPIVSHRLRHGVVSCGGKIVPPREIVDFRRKLRRNLLGIICGTGVHQNDLIHQFRHRVQTALQHRFLIPNDHAQTHQRHSSFPFPMIFPSLYDDLRKLSLKTKCAPPFSQQDTCIFGDLF